MTFILLNLERSSEGSEVTLGPLEVVQEGGNFSSQPAQSNMRKRRQGLIRARQVNRAHLVASAALGQWERMKGPLAFQPQTSKDSESSTRNRPDCYMKMWPDL